MNKDYQITTLVMITTIALIVVATRPFFLDFGSDYKYIAGFIKFFFLASLGDVIGSRIKHKRWVLPSGMFFKMMIWGFIGILVVLVFGLYNEGTWFLQQNNLLPNTQNIIVHAFFVSALMNLTFGPMMMAFHRITDTYIEERAQGNKVTLNQAIDRIDWPKFIRFVVLKTIPFFWIPAHTITFSLPSEYRVIFAALLGIVLGLLLGMFQGRKDEKAPTH